MRAMSASCSRALVVAVVRSTWTMRSMRMAAAEAYEASVALEVERDALRERQEELIERTLVVVQFESLHGDGRG